MIVIDRCFIFEFNINLVFFIMGVWSLDLVLDEIIGIIIVGIRCYLEIEINQ